MMNCCDFGDTLKKLRLNRNLTQKELGTSVGLSKAVISKYENGMAYPTFDMLIRLAYFFGVTTDFLLGVEDKKTIDVSMLTDSQVDIVHRLISEFIRTNDK